MGFHNLNIQRQRADGTLADIGAMGEILPGENIRLSSQFVPGGQMTYTIRELPSQREAFRRTVTGGISGTSVVDTTAPEEGSYMAEARTGGLIQHSSTMPFTVTVEAAPPARKPKTEGFSLFGIEIDKTLIIGGLVVVGLIAAKGMID